MIAVITGDIIQSREIQPELWLKILKKELREIGKSPLNWEIYRGDSFQAELKNPAEALARAILIKAAIKSVRGIDVRMAIGFGDKSHAASSITQSNGSAFVRSGEKFEQLVKEKRTLAILSPWKEFDTDINLFIRLALIAMDDWTTNSAEIVKASIEHPEKSQEELGKLLGIKQNAVSSRLKRAHFEEIQELIEIFRTKIYKLL